MRVLLRLAVVAAVLAVNLLALYAIVRGAAAAYQWVTR